MKLLKALAILTFLFFSFGEAISQGNQKSTIDLEKGTLFHIKNDLVQLLIKIDTLGILSDELFGVTGKNIWNDGDYLLKVMWTDWRAPGKLNNADNPIRLNRKDFIYYNYTNIKYENKEEAIILDFKGKDYPFKLSLTYVLGKDKSYYRRKVSISDTTQETHFLHMVYARYGGVGAYDEKGMLTPNVIKKGDFGQPIALQFGQFGCFTGLEYPAASNLIRLQHKDTIFVSCSQEAGCRIDHKGFDSEWVVIGFVGDTFIKKAFLDYVKDIRVLAAEPFTLYNSWYDLRSPEYPKVKPENVMNQANVFKIIDLFKKNMIDKHHIQLDAFVLDDGWDIYESDWKLRSETFPNGLKPLSDKLKPLGTRLGIWLGPTGGYSFRMKRVNWMKEHGYEVVGKNRDFAMLCMGGKNYSKLFRQRTTAFVKNEGVSYFKWDGIQFSCSEPDHGHPTGLYSRNAILDSVIDKCKAVRAINPTTYLNITSGTWLSPWWVKYANQIWMDGEDYGYADVPSVNQRDGAITYRDFVLYDDFHNKDLWFPIANLMTHGIIKGNLERLGGESDPIDKFTNDVVLYFARGISMYELYISPDLLTEGEWDAIGNGISWAKDRKDILANTFMVGGDPTQRETYGYCHYQGKHGIIAARNPVIQPSNLQITLDASQGLNPKAENLVIEQVYPYRYIFPDLYSSGSTLDIPLEGFETAIVEIYPLEEATVPLFSGLPFDAKINNDGTYALNFYGFSPKAKVLNPESYKNVLVNGQKNVRLEDLPQPRLRRSVLQNNEFLVTNKKGKDNIEIRLGLDSTATEATLALLLKPGKSYSGKDIPLLHILLDGKETKAEIEKEKGLWAWYTLELSPGSHSITLDTNNDSIKWEGNIQAWFLCKSPSYKQSLEFSPALKFKERIMPPLPMQAGIFEHDFLLGEKEIHFKP